MSVEIERDLPVRARDGTILRVDVYRPDNSGACPALLLTTRISFRDRLALLFGLGNRYDLFGSEQEGRVKRTLIGHPGS